MKEINLNTEYTELIDLLTDEQAGLLLKAVMHYAADGGVEASITQYFDSGVDIMFALIRKGIDGKGTS